MISAGVLVQVITPAVPITDNSDMFVYASHVYLRLYGMVQEVRHIPCCEV